MKRFVILILLLLSTAAFAFAEPMAEADIPVRYTTWHISYEVKADGSYIETQKWSVAILKENAVEWGKRDMSHSARVSQRVKCSKHIR